MFETVFGVALRFLPQAISPLLEAGDLEVVDTV